MSSFGEFGLRGIRRARSPTPFFVAPRLAPPSTLAESPCCLRLRRWRFGLRLSSLAFVFAVGALVFAFLRLPWSSLSAPWSSLLFACLRLRLSRWASRRPCHWIRMDRGPSVDGQRWHPQQYPTSCVVVCIPSGIVRYFGGVPARPYMVWGNRVT